MRKTQPLCIFIFHFKLIDFIFKFLQRIYQFFLIPDSRVISQHDRLLCCLLYKFSQNQPPHPCCIPSIKWMQACVSTIYNTAAIVLQPFFCNFVRIGICHKSRMLLWALCPGEKPDSCRIQAKTGIAPRGGSDMGGVRFLLITLLSSPLEY